MRVSTHVRVTGIERAGDMAVVSVRGVREPFELELEIPFAAAEALIRSEPGQVFEISMEVENVLETGPVTFTPEAGSLPFQWTEH